MEAFIHGGRARVDGMTHAFGNQLLDPHRRMVQGVS